jgi:hypothetical protein
MSEPTKAQTEQFFKRLRHHAANKVLRPSLPPAFAKAHALLSLSCSSPQPNELTVSTSLVLAGVLRLQVEQPDVVVDPARDLPLLAVLGRPPQPWRAPLVCSFDAGLSVVCFAVLFSFSTSTSPSPQPARQPTVRVLVMLSACLSAGLWQRHSLARSSSVNQSQRSSSRALPRILESRWPPLHPKKVPAHIHFVCAQSRPHP